MNEREREREVKAGKRKRRGEEENASSEDKQNRKAEHFSSKAKIRAEGRSSFSPSKT